MPIINKINHGIIVVVISFVGYLFWGLTPVSASVLEREDLNLDENLSDQTNDDYGVIQNIVVVEIPSPESINYGNAEDWYKGFYYYSIAKLGFADLPVNFVVAWDGSVFEAKLGGLEVLPLVDFENSDVMDNSVVVGYLGNNRGSTTIGDEALKLLISNLLGVYQLQSDDVVGASMYVGTKSSEVELSKLLLKSPSDSWLSFVNSLVRDISPANDYWTAEYSSSVESVEVPEQITAGDTTEIRVLVKNTGNMPWYNGGTNAVYVATSDSRNRNSSLANDDWASFSRVVTSEERVVLPNQQAVFVFSAKTSLIPKGYSEKFELMRMPLFWIDGSQFSVEFETIGGDLDLVEIQSTETGFLNVRSCPSTGCDEVGRVVPGEVLINLGEDGGWYKVELDSGVEGWVYGRYVRKLQ